MGFLGRGKGSHNTVKREGGIHASTRKSNSGDSYGSKRDQHGRSGRSNSRERSSHGRDRHRSRDRSRSPLRTQYSKDIPATESLRITVGNDIYKEKTRSPLSGRLGPPVDSSPYNDLPNNHRKSDTDSFNKFDGYNQEAKYYEHGDRRHDRDFAIGRSGGYDSNRQRNREYPSDRYEERNIDLNRDVRGRYNRYSGDERYKEDTNHRRGGSIDRRGNNRDSLERQGGYREPESDSFFRDVDHRHDTEDRTERELLGGHRDLPNRDDYQNINRSSSDDLRPTFPLIPPTPKPLKSILKKKSSSEETSTNQTTNPSAMEEKNLFPIMRQTPVLDKQGTDARIQHNNEKTIGGTLFNDQQSSDGRGNSRSGLPGMSSYMDIEDEEKFLYGDDDFDLEKGNLNKIGSKPSVESKYRSEDAFYTEVDHRHVQPDSYSKDDRFSRLSSSVGQRNYADSRQTQDQERNLDSCFLDHQIVDQPSRPTAEDQLRSSVSSFLEDQRLKHNSYPSAIRDITSVQEKPVTVQPPAFTQAFKPDLLSLFTSGNELPTILQPTPQPSQNASTSQEPIHIPQTIPYTSQVSTEEPKQKYDPTIENILKSIGFDFEMSRRMQEKASNSTPIQKPKKEEEQFGINQTASFLEGGISDDIKAKLFKKKEESIVDILMREAKVGPPKSTERKHDHENETRERYKKMEQKPSEQERRSETYKRERTREKDFLDMERKRASVEQLKKSSSDMFDESTYEDPTLSSENLSSGISFQRQIPRSDTQYSVYSGATSYSQPAYPPGLSDYTNSSSASSTQTNQGAIPPYSGANVGSMYNAPPPYGYGPPPQSFDSGSYSSYGNYPPQSTPFHPTHNPPPGQIFHGPPPTHGPPPAPHSIPPQMRKPVTTDHQSTVNKDEMQEEILEKKTITIEKKTVTISPKETNRTVLPPKIDKPKGPPEKQTADSPQKVLTPKERNALLKEREQRRQKIESLEAELQKLRKQQNEMMRKIRRQKDGHKDPVLLQNNKLQDDISAQISKLRKAAEENSKILKECKIDPNHKPEIEKDGASAEDAKESKGVRSNEELQKRKKNQQARVKKYEFFDPGGHWCKVCNTESGSVYSVLQHLHGKKHQQAMNPYDRPWVPRTMKTPQKHNKNDHLAVLPVKGQEFLVPCKAFYCTLCKEFAGDEACADFHIKTESHYQNYLKHVEKNEFYEQKRTLDKAAGRTESKDVKPVKKEDRREDKKEKNEQRKQRVQEKEKLWEKPVAELGIEQASKKPKLSPIEQKDIKTVKSSEGFGKFTFSTSDKEKSKNEDDNSEEQEKKDSEAGQESKGKIAINIINKMGIKPVPGVKITGKKNPLLPPWTPVSKPDVQKQAAGAGKVEAFPLRKGGGKTDHSGGKQTPLDMFLTLEDKSKPLPVMKDKPKVTAQDILKAFTGKLKDDNTDTAEKKTDDRVKEKTYAVKEKEKTLTSAQKEELEDLKLLGIDPLSEKPLAEKKTPPPPSQNLSLPPIRQIPSGGVEAQEKGKWI
ncbi:zinc finger protein 318-like isoform X2 [Ylistrum balloti]|uniref:zinc finger protein 318-like isoform X2 n=1 Tax=Ylistrum balloti TaxID=509963 RepID=UPI002905889F|nr:zinc finger protein 318-like isoform X2 [Ylistrum balloti]